MLIDIWLFVLYICVATIVVFVESLSHLQLFVTPWTATPGFPLLTIPQNLPKFMSIESVMPSNHLILCSPLLLPSIFPSIRVFSNESLVCISWPNYWSFSFSISSSKRYSGLIHPLFLFTYIFL